MLKFVWRYLLPILACLALLTLICWLAPREGRGQGVVYTAGHLMTSGYVVMPWSPGAKK